jgi:fluoroquinolone resistance protein
VPPKSPPPSIRRTSVTPASASAGPAGDQARTKPPPMIGRHACDLVAFVDCVFRDCDLGVLLADDCVWRDVAFERCRMQGVDWRAPKGAGLGNQLRFDGCFLRYGVFMAAHLPRVKFANSDLRETEFSDADLTGASFAGCDLSGARFHNARLTEADFRGAQGYDLDVTTKLIKGATFSMPEAVRLLNGLDITVE